MSAAEQGGRGEVGGPSRRGQASRDVRGPRGRGGRAESGRGRIGAQGTGGTGPRGEKGSWGRSCRTPPRRAWSVSGRTRAPRRSAKALRERGRGLSTRDARNKGALDPVTGSLAREKVPLWAPPSFCPRAGNFRGPRSRRTQGPSHAVRACPSCARVPAPFFCRRPSRRPRKVCHS